MALNVSSAGDKKRITFGPGVLKLGKTQTDGTTPSLADVGYARGGSLQLTRQKLDVFQGSPRALIETYAVQEDVILNFTSIQWDPAKFVFAMGSGVTSTSGAKEIFQFGGEVFFNEVGLQFIHRTPTNGTVEIKIWKAQGQGEFNINFADDVQEFAYNFRALEALTDWENASLGTNKRLAYIAFTPGP